MGGYCAVIRFLMVEWIFHDNGEIMKKCVICNKEFEKSEYYPFCSIRCKRVDLNRWLSEVYVIPDGEKEIQVFDKNNENSTGQSS